MKIKKTVSAALAVFAAAMLASCASVEEYEERVDRFVTENLTELEEMAQECISDGTSFVKFKGVELEQLLEGEHDIVQFFYSGFGIAPSSTYYGFYYSPDDVAVRYGNSDQGEFNEVGENKWEWIGDGDNGGIVTKITDNWYFYEAHF